MKFNSVKEYEAWKKEQAAKAVKKAPVKKTAATK